MTDSPSNVVVRPAVAADEPSLRHLYDEFHAFHARRIPDRLLVPSSAAAEHGSFTTAIHEILAADDATLLVAEMDGIVIGFAQIDMREDEASQYKPGRRYGHLQSLAVTEASRRRGVGALLLRDAEHWARERGATEIRSDVWEFAGGPIRFYEQAGYQTLRRTLVKRTSV